MATVQGASAHRWVPSVLLLSTLAACGGAKMAAPGAYAPSSAPSAVAHAGGGAPGMAAEASHIGVERQVVMGEDPAPAPDRPGLGTTWGEQVSAPISFSPFVRAGGQPWAEAVLHYNDARGVAAHASYLGAAPQPLEVFAGDGSISIALVDEVGRTLPGYHAGGRAMVVGNDGARYRIVVRNGTTARFEVVASVDGLDVIDGNPADPNRRGYIVDPHGVLVIDGFRTSDSSVAAFRFGKVADSYAAQTSGDRNVGVVGFAIFAERGAVWTPAELGRRDTANPFPQRGYAAPPR
ncbi:MAG TPA: hypothetical protein VK932_07725 [Kofleriaceae bacterium]|nr:hypothetical protein [Kofleriaceae bacterium]